MNRPKPILPLLAMLLISMILVVGCKKNEGGTYCDEAKQPVSHVSAGDFWILRHYLGDTLKFRVYKKQNHNAQYDYQHDVFFVATDTSTVKMIEEFYGVQSECYDNEMIRYNHRLSFTGPYKLETQIQSTVFGPELLFGFADRYFYMSSDMVSRKWGLYWIDKYKIGDSTYNNVTFTKGYMRWMSTDGYKDSTYAFYNLDYGLLKFIINDTLILERRF